MSMLRNLIHKLMWGREAAGIFPVVHHVRCPVCRYVMMYEGAGRYYCPSCHHHLVR